MSTDEEFVRVVARALRRAGIEAIAIGTGAAILQGVPILTDDIDFLVRDTEMNRRKLKGLGRALGGAWIEVSPLTRTLRLVGLRAGVDIAFDEISGGFKFESLRSRAARIVLGGEHIIAADLADVTASKEAAGRAKDVAVLPLLRDALRIRDAVARSTSKRKKPQPKR